MRKNNLIILSKILGIIILLCLSLLFLLNIKTIALTEQDTEYYLYGNPVIDVMVTKGKTIVDLTTFSIDLLAELKTQGIDSTKIPVNIKGIDTQVVDIKEAFDWKSDVSSSIGSLNIVNNGQDVTMKGNPSLPGKNAIWYIPDGNLDQEFNFDYQIDFGDSFNAAGMLLNVEQTGNTLKGYMLSFNNYNWVAGSDGTNGSIWEFEYTIGQNSTNITKTLRKTLNISKSGRLKVTATSGSISVSGGGLVGEQTYLITTAYGSGFGFFSDHYSHNCQSIGAFTLKNITLKTVYYKTLEEALNESSWTDNSIRFIANVVDNKDNNLINSTYISRVTGMMKNQRVNYVGWGTNQNITEMQNISTQNTDNSIYTNGIFTNNADYTNAIKETAAYIRSKFFIIEEKRTGIKLDGTKVDLAKSNTLIAIGNTYSGSIRKYTGYTYVENSINNVLQTSQIPTINKITNNKTIEYYYYEMVEDVDGNISGQIKGKTWIDQNENASYESEEILKQDIDIKLINSINRKYNKLQCKNQYKWRI